MHYEFETSTAVSIDATDNLTNSYKRKMASALQQTDCDSANVATASAQSKSTTRRNARGLSGYETIHQKPKMPRMGYNESLAKRVERQINRQIAKEDKAAAQTDAQFNYNNRITQRESNKANQQKRLHTNCFKDISPYLNPQFNMELTTEERLIHYSKSHKCAHGRAYNIIEMVQCLCENPIFLYRVSCDHEREVITKTPYGKCRRCARSTTLLDRNCYCNASYCEWCRFSTYSLQLGDQYITKVVCVCGKKIINTPIPNIIVTKSRRRARKMWKTPKPSQAAPVLSLEEFPLLTTAHSGSISPISLNESETPVVLEDIPCTVCGLGSFDSRHPVHPMCQANPFNCICEDQPEHMATCFPCSISYLAGYQQPCCNMWNITEMFASFFVGKTSMEKRRICNLLREYSQALHPTSWSEQVKQYIANFLENYRSYSTIDPSIPTVAHSGFQKQMFVKDENGNFTKQLNFPSKLAHYTDQYVTQRDGTVKLQRGVMVTGKTAAIRQERLRQLEEWTKTHTSPHGGALSVAKDTFSSIGSAILEAGKKCIDFIKSMFNASLEATKDAYQRARLHLKSCYIVQRIEQLLKYLKANPLLVSALVGTFVSAITAENRVAQVASVISTLILIWGIIKSEPINKHDLMKDAEVNTGDEDLICGEVDDDLSSFFSSIHNEVNTEEAHSMEEYMPNMVEKFTAIFGFTKSVMNRAWPFAKASFAAFLTAMALRKGLSEFFEYFAKFLPDWIRALTIAGNSKLLIRLHTLDEKTPLGKAYRSAMAVKLAAEDGLQADEVQPIKDEAAADYKIWLKYIQEKSIPLDNDITKLNTILEEYGNTICKAKPRKIEPFMIRVSGASGVGKSTIWPILLSYLPGFQDCESKEDISKLVYTRCITDEFWSGYNNTFKCVRYDDFAQQRDEIDLQEIIGLGGEAPFMPAMPSINPKDDKIGVKGTMVTADYILMLSNSHDLRPTTLNCAEAINRRRHIHISIDFKNKDHVKRPDFSHMEIKLQFSRYQTAPKFMVFENIPEVAMFIKKEHELFLEAQQEVSTSIDSFLFRNTVPVTLDRISDLTDKVKTVKDTIKHLGEQENKLLDKIRKGVPVSKNEIYGLKKSEEDDMHSVIEEDSDDETPTDRFLETKTRAHAGETDEKPKSKYWTIAYYKQLASNFIKNVRTKAYDAWTATSKLFWKMKDIFCSFIVDTIRFTSDIIYIAAIASISSILTVVGTVKLLNYLYPPTEDAHSGTTKTTRYNPIKMTPHGGNAEDVSRLLHQNVIRICCPDKNAEQCAYFVSGSTILLNEHFFLSPEPLGDRYIPDGTELSFYTETSKIPERFLFDKNSLEVIKSNSGGFKDAVLYRLPATIMKRRSLVNHFWDGTTDLRNRKVMHVQIDKRGDPKTTVCSVSGDENYTLYNLNFNGNVKEVHVVDAFYYDYRSVHGDCGSPVMAVDDHMIRKILGFHVSGNEHFGYSVAVMVTQDMLLKTLAALDARTGPEIVRQTDPHSMIVPADRQDVIKGNLEGKLHVYGIIHKNMAPSMKSTIKRSPLHDCIGEHKTIPAHLNFTKLWKEEGIDLLRKGANKYAGESVLIPVDMVHEVQESMASDLFSKMDTVTPRRVLTLNEAINGNPDFPYIAGLNMSTSPGFPWVLDPRYRGAKRNLFVMTENGYEAIPVLQTAINDTIELVKKGIIPELPYIDALKDERRPIHKVQQHKTRMFSICPLVMTIIGRMYQLSFLSHMMQKRCTTWSMIGINKNSTEWQAMWNHLARMGVDNAFDGDYEQYDGLLNKQLAMIHFWLSRRYYQLYDKEWTQTDDIAREVIMYFNCEAMHALYCVVTMVLIVYISNGGNPSGQDGTTPTNTNANEAAMRMAWLTLAPVNMKDLYYYIRLVSNAIYGDDIVTSVRSVAKDFFGPDKIQTAMAKIGMKYGPADKLSSVGHFNHLKDCTFLKNSTGDFHGFKVPLMDEDALYETIHWVREDKNSPAPEIATEDNCNAILRSLVFYGPEKYTKFRNAILEYRPNYHLLQYSHLRDEFMQTGTVNDPFNDNGCGTRSRNL